MKMRLKKAVLAAGLISVCIGGVWADGEPPAEPLFKIDGEIRERGEYRQNGDLNRSAEDKDASTLSRIRLGVSVTPIKDLTGYVQLQDSRVWGTEASTGSNEKNLDIHQGYLKADAIWGWLGVQAGRFEMIYGDERLIGAFNWNNVGRAFDGGRLSVPVGGVGRIDLFSAKVFESTPKTGDTNDSDFSGLYFAGKKETALEGVDVYLLRLGDRRKSDGEVAGTKGRTDFLTAGARYARKFGETEIRIEGAKQTGTRNGDDHSAWMMAAHLEQRFAISDTFAGIGVGYAAASGDAKADGKSREFDNLFPTNHPLYGLMDQFGLRNLSNPYLRLWVKPMGTLINLDVHSFSLDQSRGAWKSAAGVVLGRDATGASGKRVGEEADLIVTVPLVDHLKAQVGVARFWPADYAKKVRGKDPQDWMYLQLTMNF